MKRSTLTLSLVFIFLSTFVIAQSKYDKVLVKADGYYDQGDYKKAQKTLEKLRKKAKKKLGAGNKYEAIAKMELVKYNMEMGQMGGFETQLQDAIISSITANGDGTPEHGLTLLDAAKLYIQYGNYVKAQEFVDMATEMMKNSGSMNESIKAKLGLEQARVLSARGFYRDALKIIEEHETYFNQRAVNRVSEVDPKTGKLKSRVLDPDERNKRYEEKYEFLILKANTLGRMGDINQSFPLAHSLTGQISRDLGKGHKLYATNLYLDAQILEANGILESTKEAGDQLDDAKKAIEKDHKPQHGLKLVIQNAILKNYLLQGEKRKYNKEQALYEKEIKSYYGKENLHYIVNNTLELSAKLSKEKVTNLENKASVVLANNSLLPLNHPIRIELMEFLYQVALVDGMYANAENYLNEILKIKKEIYGDDSPIYHMTRIDLATHKYRYNDEISEAEEIYTASFENVVRPQIERSHNYYSETLYNLAELYEITDRNSLAKKVLEENEKVVQEKYDTSTPEFGIAKDRLAELFIKIGEYDDANANIDKSTELLRKFRGEGYRIPYSKALETHAKLLAIEGQFDEAEDALNKSQKEANRASIAMQINSEGTIDELAGLYIAIGKYSETEKLLLQSIAEKEQEFGKDSRKLLKPLINLGQLKLIFGEYPEAEKIAQRAVTIGNDFYGDNSTKIAPALILMTEINIAIGDYDKAEQNIRKAINIQENQFTRNHIDVAKSISKLALIKFYKGDEIKEVEDLFIEAKFIVSGKLGSSNPQYALILKDLATLYIADQKFDEAFRLLEEAESIWAERLGRRNNVNAANIYLLEGDIYYVQHKYPEAEESYMKAKRLYQRIFNKNHPEYVKVLSKLSKVYYMTKDYKKSKNNLDEALENYQNFIKNYFPALSEREKTKYWNTIKDDFEFYNTFALEHQNEFPDLIPTVFNNALLTKAILLSSSIKMRQRILNSGDEGLKAKYNEWVLKKEVLTTVLSMSKDQLLENQINPDAMVHEVEQLEKELSENSELFAEGFENKSITWENIEDVLKPNEVAIEMVRFRYFDEVLRQDSIIYMGLVARNGAQKPELIVMNNGYDLENKFMKGYRNSMKFRIADRYSYTNYWEPIKNKVGEFSTIYLSADGVFNQINLETIPTGDGKYVLDNSNIILVSNSKDIYFHRVRTKQVQESKRASMFGNPVFYASSGGRHEWSDLPGTQREIDALNEILEDNGWANDYYVREYATEDRIKEIDNPRILHIATHGFFTPSVEFKSLGADDARAGQSPLLRTGLLLYGAGDIMNENKFNYNAESGILTAYEAMNLNLDFTELVILSACETGLGEVSSGEGVYGLQRAILVAGANSLVMSLFKVSDEATQKLMETFYRKWFATGEMRQSFIEAKKELRNEFNDPIFWGAFVMIGME